MNATSSQQLTVEGVYQALNAASSQDDAQQRKLGEDQLRIWEVLTHFHEYLQVSEFFCCQLIGKACYISNLFAR